MQWRGIRVRRRRKKAFRMHSYVNILEERKKPEVFPLKLLFLLSKYHHHSYPWEMYRKSYLWDMRRCLIDDQHTVVCVDCFQPLTNLIIFFLLSYWMTKGFYFMVIVLCGNYQGEFGRCVSTWLTMIWLSRNLIFIIHFRN